MWKTRSAEESDVPFLLELFASGRAEEVAAWGWPEAQRQAFLHMQFQARQHSYAAEFPGVEHRIIIRDEQSVGHLMLWHGPEAIRIVDIALLPAFQGQGIGGEILRGVQLEARAKGRQIRLSVLRGSPARRLYERLGFTLVEVGEVYETMAWAPAAGST